MGDHGRPGLRQKKIITAKARTELLDVEPMIEMDRPAPFVARITLNRPDIENRFNNAMKAQLFNQLQLNDQDPDIRCTIIRGAGANFCGGYEAQSQVTMNQPLPFFTDESDGQKERNALQAWFMMQDMSKPIIAQVHGKCIGIGNDLASACDIVYVTPSAQVGYPEGRNHGLPDAQTYPWTMGMRNALSMLLAAETMDGNTCVERGWATSCFPEEELDALVLEKASRVAKIPADLLAFNKRSVYRAFEAQGMRTNLRNGIDLQALMYQSVSGNLLTLAENKDAQAASRGQRGRGRGRGSPRKSAAPAKKASPPAKKVAAPAKKAAAPAKKAAPPAKKAAPPAKKAAPIKKAAPPAKKQVAPVPVPSPASMAAQIVPTPVNNSSPEEEEPVTIHINQRLTIHIHNDEDEEPRSKL